MRASLILLSLLIAAPAAFAQAPISRPAKRKPVPPHVSLEAIRLKQAADEHFAEGRLPEARTAIDGALKLAPDWPEAFQTSARVHLVTAGPASELSALARPREGVDYAAMLLELQGAARDLETFVKLAPRDPDVGDANGQLGVLAGRIALVQQILRAQEERAAAVRRAEEARAREEAAARAAADTARRIEEEAARRRAQAEQQAALARARAETRRLTRLTLERLAREEDLPRASRRATGMGFMIAGALLGAAALTCAYQGSATNDAIQQGGFTSRDGMASKLRDGQIYNWIAIGTGIGAGLAVAIGAPLYFFNLRRAPAAILVGPGPGVAGAALTLVLR
jgi:hypothetical protein